MAAWATKHALHERCATSTGLIFGFLVWMLSIQFLCCSGLLYNLIPFGLITALVIAALLASKAGDFGEDGSEAVTGSSPRDTKIQPSVPSKRKPLGNLPLTITLTSFLYFMVTSKSPCTFQKP